MAILIDMDIPKLCQYCHLWDEEYMACKLHKPNGKCPLREVVMCKDCKHYEPAHILHKDGTKTYVNENDEWVTADVGINVGGKCQNSGMKIHCIAHNCKEIVIFRNPMDYCSYGERRGE